MTQPRRSSAPTPEPKRTGSLLVRDLAIAFGAFFAGTLIAELLGAVDLGTALTFGSIAFMAAIVGSILIRGPRSGDPPA